MRFSKFLTLLGVGSAISAGAQTFVPTTAQKKVPVLEEYTGVRCGFCPAGHIIGSNIKAANPKAVIINLHGAPYGPGSATMVDLRSDVSFDLDSVADPSGYPAGSVNRVGKATGRGGWTSAANTIATQNSPVNVAAKASIDLNTRELEVIVETYYTANSSASTNKLNVFILQNNIAGYQASGSTNPANVLPNGDYNHMHALRHSLTGSWGQTISTTTAGYFQADTFNYTIPAKFNAWTRSQVAANPDAILKDLEIAVSIAENDSANIYTGAVADMTLIAPPGQTVAEARLESKGIAGAGYCSLDYTPSFTFENLGTSAIDTVRIMAYTGTYSATATPLLDTLVTSPTAAGASRTITWGVQQWGDKNVTYVFDIDSYNGGNLYNVSNTNYSTQTPSIKFDLINGNPNVLSTLLEDFEAVVGPNIPNNGYGVPSTAISILDNPSNLPGSQVAVFHTTHLNGAPNKMGANGTSDASYRFRFSSIDEGAVKLVFEPLNVAQANKNAAKLKFFHAYVQYSQNGTAVGQDSLKVLVSTDCGSTWNVVFGEGGSKIATATATANAHYPAAAEWDSTEIDLTSYVNATELVIAFEGISDYGNNLYLDDINVISYDKTVATAEAVETFNTAVAVYPNPVANEMSIELTNAVSSEASVSVFNAVGQAVISLGSVNLEEGIQTLNVNTSDLVNGVYFVNIVSDNGNTTKRFVVSK